MNEVASEYWRFSPGLIEVYSEVKKIR